MQAEEDEDHLLCHDVVFLVLEWLNRPRDLVHGFLVCKRWAACDTEVFWHSIHDRWLGGIKREELWKTSAMEGLKQLAQWEKLEEEAEEEDKREECKKQKWVWAIAKGYPSVLTRFCLQKPYRNWVNVGLFAAAFCNQPWSITALIDHAEGYIDINYKVIREDIEYLKTLGHEIDVVNSGSTAFFIACRYGRLEAVKALAAAKVDMHLGKDNGVFPLYTACQNNHLEVAKYLIDELHIPINRSEPTGWSIFHVTAERGHLEVAKYLLSKGVNVNTYALNDPDFTPLRTTLVNGHFDIVKVMLESGLVDKATLSYDFEYYLRSQGHDALADLMAKLLQ